MPDHTKRRRPDEGAFSVLEMTLSVSPRSVAFVDVVSIKEEEGCTIREHLRLEDLMEVDRATEDDVRAGARMLAPLVGITPQEAASILLRRARGYSLEEDLPFIELVNQHALIRHFSRTYRR